MRISKKRNVIVILILILIGTGICYIRLSKHQELTQKIEKMFCRVPSTWDYLPLPSKRTINFPENEAVGLLYTTTDKLNYEWQQTQITWTLYGPARGEIKLPEGTSAFLEIKQDFSSIISELEPNDIQAIDFSAPIDLPFELYTKNQTKRIAQLSDEELEPIKNLNGLYQLVLHNTTITNKSLLYISEVKSLRSINLWNTKITDEGLAYLAELPFLEEIYLGATDISDEGLKHISKMTKLRGLYLTGSYRHKGTKIANASAVNPKITDAGMHHLTTLSSLKYLYVDGTNVTDKGLSILPQLTSLRRLSISGKKVTEEGIRKLQAVLPDCQIIHNPG